MKTSPYWILILLVTVCFTLGVTLELHVGNKETGNSQSNSAFKLLFGEGQRLFANEFYAMGDAYFHGGYYPSIFDQPEGESHILAASRGKNDEGDTTNVDFFGSPKDWIDRFGSHFRVDQHTHLQDTNVQEILPWLKLAADTNPQMIETYTVAAYMLRKSVHNPKEAETFLREGLRNNPGNCEILFALGQIYNEDYHDANRARNVWLAALRYWRAQGDDAKKSAENERLYDAVLVNLAYLEQNAGNWSQAIEYFEMAKPMSPDPDAIQKRIDEARQKLAEQPPASNALSH
jgi:tetratricopeptide (TPR) repeat protein